MMWSRLGLLTALLAGAAVELSARNTCAQVSPPAQPAEPAKPPEAAKPPDGTSPSEAAKPSPSPSPSDEARSAEAAKAAEAGKPVDIGKPRMQLDTIGSVTGSMSVQRSTVFDSPRATSTVETDELRGRPPRSVGDALRDEEGVTILQPSYGFQNPSLRGLGEGRVQILVDGIRLNNTITSTLPGGTTNLNLIDPYTVRAIETVRGPGLATFGDGGLGGTLYLRTLRPMPIAGSSVELSAGARGIYTSPDQGIQGSIMGGGRWNRFAMETAFSVRRFRDLMGGSQGGSQPLTGYSEGGLYIGAGVDLGRGSLVLVYQGVRQYDGMRRERSQTEDLYTLPEVARDLGYMRYEGDFELAGRPVEVVATLSYQRQEEGAGRQQILLDRLLRMRNRVDVFGVQARARVDLGRAGSLGLGLEGAFEWVTSGAERSALHDGATALPMDASAEARYPGGGRAQTVALFLQDEIDLERLFRGRSGGPNGERPGRLRALLGARGGANFLRIGSDDRLQRLLGGVMTETLPERQLNKPLYGGSLHVRYEFYPGVALSVGGLTGVRVPNLDDQARLDRGRPGMLIPAQTPLSPESAYSAEVGLRSAYRRLEGSAYYAFTYLDSPILTTPTTLGPMNLGCVAGLDGPGCEQLLTRANGPSAMLHSVEGNARVYMFWGLSALASVTYTYAAPGPDGSPPIGRVPPVHGVAALEFSRPRTVFSYAQLVLRWAGPQRRLAAEDLFDPTICLPALPMGACSGTPGFLVLSLRSALRLSSQIHMTGVIENITNDSYRFHGSAVDGPGVGVHVAVEANY
jgi:hemoglobin/transferrin/lactoferrin receptor protein